MQSNMDKQINKQAELGRRQVDSQWPYTAAGGDTKKKGVRAGEVWKSACTE